MEQGRTSLYYKVLLGMIAIISIIIFFIGSLLIGMEKNIFMVHIQERAEAIVEVTVGSLENAVLNYETVSLTALATHISDRKDVVYLRFFDAQGRTIAKNNESETEEKLDKKDILELSRPVNFREGNPGTVKIGLSMLPMKREIEKTTLNLTLILVGSIIILSTLLGLAVKKIIIRPILELTRVAQAVGRGELEQKVIIETGDEIGQLGIAFNQMGKNLRKSKEQVEGYSETLEQKVEERTKELAKAKEMTAAITDGIGEGILLLSKDFKILWANKKIRDITGFKEEEMIGNFCYKVTYQHEKPCEAPHDICPVTELLNAGKPVSVTHTHFDKEGNKRYVEVRAYPIKDKKGEIVQFVHISRDITERKKLEGKLEKHTVELEREVKERTGELQRAKENLEEKVTERTQQLELKVEELEQLSRVSIDRELKMIELKKKIKDLEAKT